MTDRLKAALQLLNDEELEEVTRLAETLARAKQAAAISPPSTWRLDWVGALRHRPERSGVEAQGAAMREWVKLVRGRESA